MSERPDRPGAEHSESRAVITVLGLGPAGPELVPSEVADIVAGSTTFLRTARHPAAELFEGLPSFDDVYEKAASFDQVYATIVEALVDAARHAPATARDSGIAYLVPGSPMVAERTVELLRADGRVNVSVHPAPSFLDLAWDRLGIDPVSAGVRLADATAFDGAAEAGGPLLLCQCWSPLVLSEVKLAVSAELAAPLSGVTVLHHLGLPDERVEPVRWDDLDRLTWVDHLTSIWVPELRGHLGGEMVALDELSRVLRLECPWDREQTHQSLRRHALEEAYEVVEAIDDLDGDDLDGAAVAHLQEELGDLLFQVVIHARLATEEGWFTLADVAEGIRTKLIQRHPHVFGDVAADTSEQVARNWEQLKAKEKERESALDGVVWSLPALALVLDLQRKAERVGFDASGLWTGPDADALEAVGADRDDHGPDREVARELWSICARARSFGIDAELALHDLARRFDQLVRAWEASQAGSPKHG